MEIEFDLLETALTSPKDKAAKKYLSTLAEELKREEPEHYARLLKTVPQGERAALSVRYRCSRIWCAAALALAAAVVIASYLLGDFGAMVLTGWANRYRLSAAIVLAMGILVLAGLYSGRARDLLLAAALLEEKNSRKKS